MVTLLGKRIRYSHLLVHHVGGDLASDVEERGNCVVFAPTEWWISY
jgi:hypothetical protein